MARTRTYKVEGVVLRHVPFGEAERILTVYTREFGKLRCVGRGVRRIKSKLGGHLEPCTHFLGHLSEGKTIDIITEAETLQSFRIIKEDLDRLSKAIYFAELVDSFSVDNVPSHLVFNTYLDVLYALQNENIPSHLVMYFQIFLLSQSGFGPELYCCVDCGMKIAPEAHLFSCVKGGIVCSDCHRHSGETLVNISINGLKLIRFLQGQKQPDLSQIKIPTADFSAAERLLTIYLRNVLERELKSVKFMDLISKR